MEDTIEEVGVLIDYSVEEELPSMLELFSIQSYTKKEHNMISYVYSKLEEIEGVITESDDYGNILVRKGELEEGEFYPCLISHLDTVHDFVEGYKVRVKKVDGLTKVWATCTEDTTSFHNRPFFGYKPYEDIKPKNTNQTFNAGIGGDKIIVSL